ncbi:MAG: methyltransferase domain-containing protein [Sulfurovum sp.]|nr:methyltransferase domain-containing protein [Sulfurovum sp.]
MAQKDQLKWDKKYMDNAGLLMPRKPSPLLQKYMTHAPTNKALDVACGTGRNTLFLADNGFEVDALDISAVALQELSQHMKKVTDISKIHTQLIDLEQYEPPISHYGLILQSNFLVRSLISKLSEALVKNGILIIDTYMIHEENEKSPSNPDFYLHPNELKGFFGDKYEILEYKEYWNGCEETRHMRKQAIIVEKLS